MCKNYPPYHVGEKDEDAISRKIVKYEGALNVVEHQQHEGGI